MAALDPDLQDPAPDPERSLLGHEQLARVRNVLAEVKEDARAAFLLRVQHGMRYEDIARTLGLSLSAAKVKVHRVRLRLAAVRNEEDAT